jgi:hypothetical protein
MMSVFGQQNSSPNSNSGQPGIIQQIITAIIWASLIYLALLFMELVYKYINRLSINRTVLLPKTYTMKDAINISQNPNVAGSKPIHLSENERTGIEFSYSFYLYVDPASFRQEFGLLHIFHKGYSSQFPLLAPGVYMRSDTNTLRVYMNTYKTWNNYVEVENIPVGKWVHVVVVCKELSLEIYINGNLAKKLPFEGFAPYQNYEDICCFSQRRITMKNSIVPSTDQNGFDVFGCMKGMISRLNYFSYALCYAEIQQLMNEGPSSKMDSSLNTTNIPPYLNDTWWSQGY